MDHVARDGRGLGDEVVDGVDVDAEPCTTTSIGLLGRGVGAHFIGAARQHGGVRSKWRTT